MTYAFDRIKVLIVEDNAPMLEICRSLLMAFGVKDVFGTHSGMDGFQVFCKEKPDLVIADWMMEPTSGIFLTEQIRHNTLSPNKFAPIILMTGFSEKKRVIEARDAGVTEFLVKPFSARDLYKRVAQIIERPRQFVRTEEFFGPDRRRKVDQNFSGFLKREDDDIQKRLEQRLRMKEASLSLDKMRDQAGLEKGDKIDDSKIDTDPYEIDFR